jgi:hypothetical protein
MEGHSDPEAILREANRHRREAEQKPNEGAHVQPEPDSELQDLFQGMGFLAYALDTASIRYAYIGGCAVAAHGGSRITQDLDLVVNLSAAETESLADRLVRMFPQQFTIQLDPTFRIPVINYIGSSDLITVDFFSPEVWVNRPQYSGIMTPQRVITRKIETPGPWGDTVDVSVFSAEWLLREKLNTWYARRDGPKTWSDVLDVAALIPRSQPGSLLLDVTSEENSEELRNSVARFVQAFPEWRERLLALVTWHDCPL